MGKEFKRALDLSFTFDITSIIYYTNACIVSRCKSSQKHIKRCHIKVGGICFVFSALILDSRRYSRLTLFISELLLNVFRSVRFLLDRWFSCYSNWYNILSMSQAVPYLVERICQSFFE